VIGNIFLIPATTVRIFNNEAPIVLPDRSMAQVLNEIRNASKILFSNISPPYPPWAIMGDLNKVGVSGKCLWAIEDLNL
jgi:hypothetical protein